MPEQTRVLIVDDEDLVRLNLRAFLEDLGFTVREASNGRMALDLAKRARPDLVLTDLRMPEMDGLMLIENLQEVYPDIPVIVISGTGTLKDAITAVRLGAWDYLIKPVEDLAGFEIIIKRALERARLITENRRYAEHLEDLVRQQVRKIAESEARYKKLLESVTSYVYTVTFRDGGYHSTAHGHGCEAVTGFTPREYDEDPNLWYRMIHEDDRGHVLEMVARIQGEEAPLSFEHRITHKDSSTRWVQNTFVPHRDAEGLLSSYDCIISDITGRKKDAEEKRLLEAQLWQAQKIESIGTLAGGIAHDFNNILTSIIGFTELAQMEREDGHSIEKELQEVLRASMRAKDLVKQILTFSRKADIKKEPMEILPLIKETLKFIRASLPASIEIKQDIRENDAMIMGNPTQIHQVLMNLCTNAAHAMQDSGGVLTIGLEELPPEEGHTGRHGKPNTRPGLRLSVSDTGTGIPPDIIDRIFEPFFTTKDRGQGTGMGLSVVHGIIEDMGGAISVHSTPGNGAVFHILLPRYEGVKEQYDAKTLLPGKRSGRILFVDDEAGIIVPVRMILERLGYEVAATTSAIEALEIFQSRPESFDLVLTDLSMPKITGIELSKRMLKIRQDIPILLCTGFCTSAEEKKIKEAGIKGLVVKPVIPEDLDLAINAIMPSQESAPRHDSTIQK